jgi:transposase-like protein
MSERAKYWSDLVAAWSQSGLSQAEFCRRRGINGGTFVWWKRQLQKPAGDGPKRRGRPPKASSRFVEVRLTGTSSISTYEVVLARGRSIRVPSQFDPQILSRLIAAVESC